MIKRQSYRYEISDLYAQVSEDFGMSWKELQVRDVSDHGLFVNELYKPRTELLVRFSMPGDLGKLTLAFTVKRVAWHVPSARARLRGCGGVLSFGSDAQRKIWLSFQTYLRNQQIIRVSKRIIEEMTGRGLLK